MADDSGYRRTTRDEMRIFGICVNGQNCRVQESSRLRTLIVEMEKPLNCTQIRHALSSYLGPWYSFNLPSRNLEVQEDIEKSKPVFVHLQFKSHNEAWRCFDRLIKASGEGAPIKASWVKSENYFRVSKKAKEMDIERVGKNM